MHIRNHLLCSLVFAGLTGLFANQAFAFEFAELSQCREHFIKQVSPGSSNIAEMDTWCINTAKMDAVVVCGDQRLYTFMTTNSVNNTQKEEYRRSYRQICQNEQQARLATATVSQGVTPVIATTAGNSATQAAPGTANAAPVPPDPASPSFAARNRDCTALPATERQTCNVAKQQAASAYDQAYRVYTANLATYNQQQQAAAEAAANARQQQAQQTAGQRNAMIQQGMGAVAQALGGGAGQNPNRTGGTADRANPTNSAAATNAVNPYTGRPVASLTDTTTPQIGGQAAAEAREALNGTPEGNAVTNNVVESSRNLPAPVETEITANANETTNKLDREVSQLEAAVQAIVADPNGNGVAKSTLSTSVENIKTQVQQFRTKKDLCAKRAERANQLCIEGTSPGAQAARALVNYAGPVLAAASSAQKSCSGTRKIMNLAAIGLTAAKGACVAAKMTCDSVCDGALKASQTVESLLANLGNQIDRAADPVPPATGPVPATTVSRAKEKTSSVSREFTAEGDASAPTGRTAGMIRSCNEKTEDIMLMATNIMAMVAAGASAKKCEEQLASGGGSGTGGGPSVAEYCSQPGNSSTQFCQCQSSPNSSECTGVNTAGVPSASGTDQFGANLRTGTGPSGFAGSGAGSGGGSGGRDFDLGVGAAEAALFGTPSGTPTTAGADGGQGGQMGGSVSPSGGGGGGGAATAAATGAGSKAAAEDKKWGFGSFGSGGGNSGAGNKGNYGMNGALSPQQRAAIDRKIASERRAQEISSASGTDNFSKVKRSYSQRVDTFMSEP